MKSKISFMTVLVILTVAFSLVMISKQALVAGEAHAQGKIKLAALDKMAKAQSARRFNYLYPKLSRYLRECFSKDGRFDLISPEEVGQALRTAGVGKETMDPDNADQIREIGRRAGADVVFISYYYEMGGHAMPMHSNNVLTLVWVEGDHMVKLDKDYTRVLSKADLVSSDIEAFKELLSKASALRQAR
jgi:hypothetical protein